MADADFTTSSEFSVAMTEAVDAAAQAHLLQHVCRALRQEDVCLGLWHPSRGDQRSTALLFQLILPQAGERVLQGNVTFTSAYFERGVKVARERGVGLAVLHSHLGPGWQGMSDDDVDAERGRAPRVLTATGLPLLGMTVATDAAWSARFWPRTAPRTYPPRWCDAVRVVGKRLRATFHPTLRPAPRSRDELRRTISVWGEAAQADLSRLHVGVIGLGSVGRVVAEALVRMGIECLTLLDFDRVEPHNLDRLLGATRGDATAKRLKVDVAREGLLTAATSAAPQLRAVAASVVEMAGYRAALDCDVLFSCVDRPWPRRVLNHLAFAHLIPVVDGGVIVRMSGRDFRGAEWSVRTAAPGRACLACAGAYARGLVAVEQDDLLDDPTYLQGLDPDHPLRRNENVFPFCLSVAAHEILQLVAMATNLRNIPDFYDQRYHYNLGQMKVERKRCDEHCDFPGLIATGDSVYPGTAITGHHHAAERARKAGVTAPPPPAVERANGFAWWQTILRRIGLA